MARGGALGAELVEEFVIVDENGAGGLAGGGVRQGVSAGDDVGSGDSGFRGGGGYGEVPVSLFPGGGIN